MTLLEYFPSLYMLIIYINVTLMCKTRAVAVPIQLS